MDREALAKQQRRQKIVERSLQAAIVLGVVALGHWHDKVYAQPEPKVIITLEKVPQTKLAGGN